MAYRLEADEELGPGLARVAREELDDALAQLREGIEEDEVAAVHEARKSLKKERALLRLARAAVPRATRRAEGTRLRDAGRRLSATRDAQVALETVDGLAERYAGRLPEAAFGRIHRAVRAHGPGGDAGEPLRAIAAAVAAELEGARAAVEDWAPCPRGWEEVEPGLARTYADGRRALAAIEERPGDEELHEWRKRAKDLWYHQRLLQPLWPAVMDVQADALDDLGQALGDDQDLANLRRTLRSLAEADGAPAAEVEAMLELLDARREQLRQEALRLGRRVYAERPKAFVRRHRAYARAWEAEREREGAPATPAGS
jgi:CHAD domain-containing protein